MDRDSGLGRRFGYDMDTIRMHCGYVADIVDA